MLHTAGTGYLKVPLSLSLCLLLLSYTLSLSVLPSSLWHAESASASAQVEFMLPNKQLKPKATTTKRNVLHALQHLQTHTHSQANTHARCVPIHTHFLAQLYFDYARFGTPHSLDISTHNNATSWTRIRTHSCNTLCPLTALPLIALPRPAAIPWPVPG